MCMPLSQYMYKDPFIQYFFTRLLYTSYKFNINFLESGQTKTLTWCDHDLMLLGAKTEEGKVILRVNIPDAAPCLAYERHVELAILDCG